MIEIKNLNKSFGKEKVFDNYSLNIEEEKITAIMGGSGVGKTTLLRILSHLDNDFEGTIINKPEKPSWVFQEDRLLPWLSVYQNLQLILPPDKPNIKAKIDNILQKVGLVEAKAKKPNELSGGMKRRVALARAFIADSKVLLLDEPFKGLDKTMKLKIANILLDEARKDKKTVLIVTHDQEIAALADCNIIID